MVGLRERPNATVPGGWPSTKPPRKGPHYVMTSPPPPGDAGIQLEVPIQLTMRGRRGTADNHRRCTLRAEVSPLDDWNDFTAFET